MLPPLTVPATAPAAAPSSPAFLLFDDRLLSALSEPARFAREIKLTNLKPLPLLASVGSIAITVHATSSSTSPCLAPDAGVEPTTPMARQAKASPQ